MVSRTNGAHDGKYRSEDCKMKTEDELNQIEKALGEKQTELPFAFDPKEAAKKYKEQRRISVPAQDVSTALVAEVVNQLMRPMLENMGNMVKQMSEAIEHIATSQDVIRNRIEALEKQVRLQTPVTDRQARYLADYARKKAEKILLLRTTDADDPPLMEDRKAVSKLSAAIKKDLLMWRGIESLREVPRCEYEVAIQRIETWNDGTVIFKEIREARKRAEESHAEDTDH